MNIGFCTCIIMVPGFWLMAVLFMLLKEKAAMLIAGFNTMSEKERCFAA